MRTQVFAHKGMVGIMSDLNADGLLNRPQDTGQLGFVLDAAFVDIQPEALELLKMVKKSSDDIGDVDVWESGGTVIFGWLGGPMKAFKPSQVEGSSSYDISLLKSVNGVKTDPKFIQFVEAELG